MEVQALVGVKVCAGPFQYNQTTRHSSESSLVSGEMIRIVKKGQDCPWFMVKSGYQDLILQQGQS